MNRLFFVLLSALLLAACGGENSVETEETSTTKKDGRIKMGRPKAGKMVTDAQRQQVQMLIATTKTAMDSIDVAYKEIRGSSRLLKLTVEERETVNEALQVLNA